ncbi:chitosanase [Streptomyces mutabilis]|jgi:chitosanase|uniref:chitosanase n=1 Tax=Streptomyces mutabilis TaxID=67332 RepID=UPI0022BA35A0|nr:chitosanase [Streptomyces mutabilis]MCZ9350609.1 chitosanase [Streptomyces mutabilis]
MKRAGVLLLAAVPVIATGVYFVMPTDSADAPVAPPVSSAQSSRQDAKSRAEQEREADDALIADLPPGLADPAKKELAQQLVSSAENSTTEWRTSYGTIEDLGDGCGYTAGIIGFCTATHDLLTLVERYTKAHPDNGLATYLPALREVDGTDSHEGLDPGFTAAWQAEAERPEFRKAQEEERDRVYFEPAVRLAKLDGLGTLGQFVYFDAMVFHGPDTDAEGFYGLRERAMEKAKTPGQAGSEKAYLTAFLDVRREAMLAKRPGIDTSRVDTAQRRWLRDGNLDLDVPLVWEMYGDTYRLP